MILASGGDLASTGISHGNSTIRICGTYPEISGIYPKKGPATIVLETVVGSRARNSIDPKSGPISKIAASFIDESGVSVKFLCFSPRKRAHNSLFFQYDTDETSQ